MDTQDHAIYHNRIHFIPTSLYRRREKTIWSQLESNPGPLASQATTLTMAPRAIKGNVYPNNFWRPNELAYD